MPQPKWTQLFLDGCVFVPSLVSLIICQQSVLQGAWGGHGSKKAKPKPHLIKKIAGVDPTKRADAGKAHVIISEKKDKKASKYLVKDLPYPYTSRAQYERSLQTPVGTEWNTRVAFQKGTMPRVIKKACLLVHGRIWSLS